MTTFKANNCTLNMCDSCRSDITLCESYHEDVKYGNGTGEDNIIECPNYDGPFGDAFPEIEVIV